MNEKIYVGYNVQTGEPMITCYDKILFENILFMTSSVTTYDKLPVNLQKTYILFNHKTVTLDDLLQKISYNSVLKQIENKNIQPN